MESDLPDFIANRELVYYGDMSEVIKLANINIAFNKDGTVRLLYKNHNGQEVFYKFGQAVDLFCEAHDLNVPPKPFFNALNKWPSYIEKFVPIEVFENLVLSSPRINIFYQHTDDEQWLDEMGYTKPGREILQIFFDLCNHWPSSKPQFQDGVSVNDYLRNQYALDENVLYDANDIIISPIDNDERALFELFIKLSLPTLDPFSMFQVIDKLAPQLNEITHDDTSLLPRDALFFKNRRPHRVDATLI